VLGDELHGLGGLAGLRGEQDGVGGLALPATPVAQAQLPAAVDLAVDLAVGVVQVGQLHDLHLGLLAPDGADMLGQLGRRAVGGMGMGGHAHAGHLHHPAQTGLPGALHEEEGGQVVQEDGADVHGHAVGARPPEVPIDDDHGHQDGHRVHDEGEQQILGDQRQHQRRRRQNL